MCKSVHYKLFCGVALDTANAVGLACRLGRCFCLWQWFKYCCGGCRAVGLALTEDVFGADLSKCLFFEGRYWQKLDSILPGYRSKYKQILDKEKE